MQNHKEENLPVLLQELFLLGKELGLMIQFWRIKDYHQDHVVFCHHWSDEKWTSAMAGGGGDKERFQYCADSPGAILYLRALQGHSGRSLIDLTLQDNVVIPSNFFQHIYHVGCAINLLSIINSGLIPGGQSLSKRQTVFFLLVDPMDKNHDDLDTIELGAPRHAQYMHKAWKKHENTVFLGRHQSCSEERNEVLSNSIERYHLLRKTPSLLFSESCSDGNWRSHIRKSIHVTSASSKDLFET